MFRRDSNDFEMIFNFATFFSVWLKIKFKLDAPSHSKPYSRWVICLKANRSYTDATAASEALMDQPVYVNWPHFTEAKVVQIFDASKKVWQSNGITKVTENPPEFHACVEQLKSRYDKR